MAAALGWELYLGPPRSPRKFGYSAPKTQIREAPPAPPRTAGEGLSRIDDPALRDLLAAVAAHWGALDDYGRGHFLADLWAAGGSGLRAQGSGIEHVVAWLGWQVIDGGRRDRDRKEE